MKEKIWHIRSDFTKSPAKDVLISVLRDDMANYHKATSELNQEIRTLDEAITFFIESLQVLYIQIDKWKTNDSNRACIAMLTSIINYVLVARHMVLLGYFSEVQEVLRSCHERTSRAILFSHSQEHTKKFLSGAKIQQAEVDKELSKLEKQPDKESELHRSLREYYGEYLSKVAHPNLKSFEYRYGEQDLSNRLGLDILLGGLMSSERGYIVITRILQTTLTALRVFKAVLNVESGEWNTRFEALKKRYDEMLDKIVTG